MKKIISIFLLSFLFLTACAADKVGLTFDEGYQTFHFKGQDYAISQVEVAEEELLDTQARFMEWPLVEKVGNEERTVSLNNLFKTKNAELAIGVQKGYYKVLPAEELAEGDRINYQEILDQYDRENEINY